MSRPVDPTWPTVDEVRAEGHRRFTAGAPTLDWIALTLDMCEAAWRASVDDPSRDLPGTVRTSPDGRRLVVRADNEYAPPGKAWARFSGFPIGDFWLSDDDVRGWALVQNIAGTPAWDAAMAEDQS